MVILTYPLTITVDKGTKGDGDEIIKYHELPITMLEIGKLLLMLWNNEDKIYPPPRFKGAKMAKDFFDEIFQTRQITDDMLHRYKLGKYSPKQR
ncbi:MAG TPA: hypothetical protein VN704_05860 [Verrucomicrobiae bacterium]|nr:hypothetical protein [Verrucomicrobiae bacterium]